MSNMFEDPDNLNEKTEDTLSIKKAFKTEAKERFKRARKKLDSSVDDVFETSELQDDSSDYLLNELKKQKDVSINSCWKGYTPKSKFNSFAFLLRKYHRIDGNNNEIFWYIEIHSDKKIICILCAKDKLFNYLSEKDYDSDTIREQLNIGKRFINPKTVKKSYEYDWRDYVNFNKKVELTDKHLQSLLSQNSWQIFSVLGYSVLSLLMDDIDTKSHKLLIPNIIYNDKTKKYVFDIINSCYIRTSESELLSTPFIKLNKDSELEKMDLDYRPFIILFTNDTDLLLRNKLRKYYSYLSTHRKVEFPYNGVPFVLSRNKISSNFLTIDLTELDETKIKATLTAIKILYCNMFQKIDFNEKAPRMKKAYFENAALDYSESFETIVEAVCDYLGITEEEFSFTEYTSAALLIACSYTLGISIKNIGIKNKAFFELTKLYFSSVESPNNCITKQLKTRICSFIDEQNAQLELLQKFINEVNKEIYKTFSIEITAEDIERQIIQLIDNEPGVNTIIDCRERRDYADKDTCTNHGFLVKIEKRKKDEKDKELILLGENLCKRIIKKIIEQENPQECSDVILQHTYKQLLKDAKNNKYSYCNDRKLCKVQFSNFSKSFLAFSVNENLNIEIDKS